MQKQDLELIFNKAKESGVKYIGVQVWTKGNEKPEIIINEMKSFDKKLEYYKNAYNDDLILKSYEGISIRAAALANSFNEIESLLVNYNMRECGEVLFGFDEAIKYLKRGFKLTKKSWHKSGMFVQMQVPDEYSKMRGKYFYITIGDYLNPWNPSQADMTEDDWMLAD